ncbi:hypothetical protein LTR37_008610 [Vermiconidia calcicola]|uniref:Uncharacterized protein n=1 Tax=Vermiconidia calcicola TaxID=1690605 RepID=A0ACC3NB51_9PEZI|nr:hypothetical protein LTR37_008610 [Vermiconidia calcicola]
MEVNFDYVQLPIFLGIDSTSKVTVTLKKGDNVREAATATAGNLNSEIHLMTHAGILYMNDATEILDKSPIGSQTGLAMSTPARTFAPKLAALDNSLQPQTWGQARSRRALTLAPKFRVWISATTKCTR